MFRLLNDEFDEHEEEQTETYAEDEEPPDTDSADHEKKNSAENTEDVEEEFTNRLENTRRRPLTIDRDSPVDPRRICPTWRTISTFERN